MFGKVLLVLGLALVGSSAAAADNAGAVCDQAADRAGRLSIPYSEPPSKLTTIFSSLAPKHPKGVFWCCGGPQIWGPSNTVGSAEIWRAAAFTPNANFSVSRIEVAAQSYFGINEVVLGLYSDNAGLPGEPIKTWKLRDMPGIDNCCTFEIKEAGGLAVQAHTQYWIVLKTDSSNKDSGVVWSYNVLDEKDSVPMAIYCSSDAGGPACANNDVWAPSSSIPVPAFAVLGVPAFTAPGTR